MEELPAAPAPVPDEAPVVPEPEVEEAPESVVVDAAEPAVLVRVAMLMVVLRAMAVPVPAEAAVPITVVVVAAAMVPFKLATMELTVLLSEAMAELTEALAMDMELVAEAEACADAEPPVTAIWPE